MSEEQTATVSEKLQKIIEEVSVLTVMELAELVKALEEKFGVSAAAPMAMVAGMGAAAGAAQVEEKTEFDVILKTVGDKKIQVIKAVREITSLGLKEAKDLVDGAPSDIKSGVSKDEAASIKEKIEAAGATVEIK